MQHVAEMQGNSDQFPEDLEWYGMDWHAPCPEDDGLTTIEVFDADIPVSAEIHEQLSIHLNTLSESCSYGIDLFISGLQFIQQLI